MSHFTSPEKNNQWPNSKSNNKQQHQSMGTTFPSAFQECHYFAKVHRCTITSSVFTKLFFPTAMTKHRCSYVKLPAVK